MKEKMPRAAKLNSKLRVSLVPKHPSPAAGRRMRLTAGAPAPNSEYHKQPGLAQMGVTADLHKTVNGVGIKIANLDGMADVSHPDLQGQVEQIKLYPGVYNNPRAHNHWHGTLTTGIMVAKADGKGIVGVAPGARVVNYVVHDDVGSWPWLDLCKRVFENIKVRNQAGANIKVVNLEYSTTDLSGVHVQAQPWLNGEIELLTRYRNDFVIVKACGNQGKVLRNPYYPPGHPGTNLKHLLMVVNVDATATRQVDSSMPGGACFYNRAVSRCVQGNYLADFCVSSPGTVLSTAPGGQYVALANGGGSSAMAHVSGAVALLFHYAAQIGKRLTPARAVSIIKRSSQNLGAAGIDGTYGYGLVNVPAAMALLRAEP